MVSADAPLRLRPLSLSELLDETFRIYRKAFPLFIGIAAAISLPTLVIALAFGVYTLLGGQYFNNPEFQNDPGSFFRSSAFASLLTAGVLWVAVTIFLVPFQYGAPVRAAIDVSLGRQPTFGSVVAAVLRRYFAIWGAGIVFAVVVGLLAITIILIPLAVWLYVRWVLFVPPMMAENLGPVRALSRSQQLVEGRWWRTCGILLLISFLLFVLGAIIGAFFTFLFALVPSLSTDSRMALQQVGNTLGSVLAAPIQSIAWTLMYFDLRVRKESFDLDQLAGAVQSSTGPSPVG